MEASEDQKLEAESKTWMTSLKEAPWKVSQQHQRNQRITCTSTPAIGAVAPHPTEAQRRCFP